MNAQIKVLTLATLTLTVSAANAQSFTGTTRDADTRFTSLTGTVNNKKIVNAYRISWGCGSTLDFVPKTLNVTPGQRFRLGTLEWCNAKGTRGGTMLTNMQVGLNFGNTGHGVVDFNLALNQSQDCNGQSCFTLPATANNGRLVLNGQAYTVTLAGFEHNSGRGRIVGNQWCTPTGTLDKVDVFATITPDAVPEPATLACLGIGAAALIRRRKKS